MAFCLFSVCCAAGSELQRGEVVLGGLRAAYEPAGAVALQQHLGAAQAAVVVVAHRAPVRARVVDDQRVAYLHLRQHPVYGELVVVLTQRAGDVVAVVALGAFLARHGYVVVRAVHGRAHEVAGGGVHADVVLVYVLHVQHLGHQAAVGSQHEAAHLGVDLHVAHARRDQDVLKAAAHPLAYSRDVGHRLARAVWYAHASGEVDERHVRARLSVQLYGQAEELRGKLRIVRLAGGVRGQEGVYAYVLHPAPGQHTEGLGYLLARHAVLGLAGVVHYAVGYGELPARVVAAAHRLRVFAHALVVERDVADVVKVDYRAQLVRKAELLGGSVVGREHDALARDAQLLAEHQLGEAGAVHAAALRAQELHYSGRGRGLDGKVLAIARVPGKSRVDTAGVFDDSALVIEVEGSWIFAAERVQLLRGDERLLVIPHIYAPNVRILAVVCRKIIII